jgi:ketosteroid isomerase-like protein
LDTQEITDLEHGLMTAMQKRDAAFLERTVGADYTMTAGVAGREVRNRSDWIDIALTQYVLDDFTFEELHVQIYPGCAIARSRFTQQASMNGSPRNSTYRMTDVWIPSEGEWQIQARHSQRVAGD